LLRRWSFLIGRNGNTHREKSGGTEGEVNATDRNANLRQSAPSTAQAQQETPIEIDGNGYTHTISVLT
jgi:hypothetical protein